MRAITVRFAFTPSPQVSHTGPQERLSMRARKNKRRDIVSMAESSTVAAPRKETAINDPSPDYFTVWNQWNIRTGASLPARRPRRPHPRLNQTVFETATDC